MHNWDYQDDVQPGNAGELWKLTRLALYGLAGEKLPAGPLRRHLEQLRIPEDRKALLRFLLQ